MLRVPFSALIIALVSAAPLSDTGLAQIAYLPSTKYDLQNAFLSSLFSSIDKSGQPSFQYELVTYESQDAINACLRDGTCLASFNYEDDLQPDANAEQIELPILDDPVLSLTVP